MSTTAGSLLLLFGNQLFPNRHLRDAKPDRVFMAESESMCRRYRAHRHKLVLILSGMRSKADALRKASYRVDYRTLGHSHGAPYIDLLAEHLDRHPCAEIVHFETESPRFEVRLDGFCRSRGLERVILDSPKFITPRREFARYRAGRKRLFMADFYKWQRREQTILLDSDGNPTGGQWSFDAANRKKLPRGLVPPLLGEPKRTAHTKSVVELVDAQFTDHPGKAEGFWLPTTEAGARRWLRTFLVERFQSFGDYEDALSREYATLFHSVLSPLLNVGLLTPDDVISKALAYADAEGVPINSLEGFVRQVIGWREFIRGAWNTLPPSHWEKNFWKHDRQLSSCWYDGSTGIPPLDDSIRRANQTGYNHHIERLMVVGNLMLLCRIDPKSAYQWFMEMYVDSADWVMAPNVYGMALFSDGGEFTTKPYICGSNYLRKMSDYPKGDWCDVVDGLYWSFVDDQRDFFAKNPRSKMMLGSLDRMGAERKTRIFDAASAFIERVTE
jgi:deoxyribodipyrimidine photolyase-related protein